MIFLVFFSISPTPSSTLVMSYILLFCLTAKLSAACQVRQLILNTSVCRQLHAVYTPCCVDRLHHIWRLNRDLQKTTFYVNVVFCFPCRWEGDGTARAKPTDQDQTNALGTRWGLYNGRGEGNIGLKSLLAKHYHGLKHKWKGKSYYNVQVTCWMENSKPINHC